MLLLLLLLFSLVAVVIVNCDVNGVSGLAADGAVLQELQVFSNDCLNILYFYFHNADCRIGV